MMIQKKIVINELWSSPMIFRRKSKKLSLSEDAKAFNTEARRRVNLYKENRNFDIVFFFIQWLEKLKYKHLYNYFFVD